MKSTAERKKKILLEICCETIQSVESVFATKVADRVELCANLPDGGTTPSVGLIKEALRMKKAMRSACKVNVLIRPRGGDFLYTNTELCVMRQDILACKKLGCNAVVLGCLSADGTVDVETTKKLVVRRVFDRCLLFTHF